MISSKTFSTALLATVVALAAAPADGAMAAGHKLRLSAPKTLYVGKPAILHARGRIPLDEVQFPYWFSLDAIPTRVTRHCPADHYAGAQLANATGGSVIVFTQPEHPDTSGRFSIPIGVRPSAPGSVLLCAYSDDGLTGTLARSQRIVHIKRRHRR